MPCCSSFLGHQTLDVVAQNGDASRVFAALWNDDVGKAFGGFDELFVHGFEHFQIAFDDHGDGAAAIDGVALNVADESLVGVAVDEDFEVHEVAQFFVEQRHDAFDDDDGFGLDVDGFGQPVALQIAVGGLFDGAPLTQVVDLFVEQFPVEGVGMVEVDGVAFFVGHV